MPLDFDELRELLLVLNQTDIAEVTLKQGDYELTVRKAVAAAAAGTAIAPVAMAAAPIAPVAAPVTTAAPLEPAAPPASPPPLNDPKLLEIKSPMVGTFYRAPAPGEPPFVQPGDRITSGQTVCIIEAMKLMNELEAEISGEVVEILVENAQPVEFDQVLMRVRPA
ncbi:MAG: acetyl-CoA carboxylase biotin carboxyl carrier protein [Limnothrix sp.]|uniref:acetyl-CoA carboxylase biotin carboxyl carrier protein n=1 Tax=unclassified Limnothrix TaxID=2632864 RepID=UPI00081EE891|nr:acetyl-CoA carboxylase biotin carboxyl carrier protein [Limnothrix sp. PR1529]MBD2160782.1 acetyl-CoA carboxylase biotin carboxyl carrier protein [Limnothrix sp. FACHB-1083]MBD2191375.1 acetyl-CoA carboxylase biotin carboxyl carrier protein [Limnothrix sp. FACHB-1088]MBD2552089.1 acetyl-CoA carboxylase biotin carboxyl carrier protein [Limnothrix sp. FACHB-708]MBD2589769.1 acetyl-CoA carboxylase biotin carboxyl carrier protein [Limnothrix sp. FACHB-406]MBD2636188.1 acetyl-CoA carboxylase bio